MPLAGQACIHTCSPVDNSGQETPLDALLTAIEGREEGWVGTGRDSGRAAIETAKRYVRWQIADHVPSPGGGEGYVCMYVCMCIR